MGVLGAFAMVPGMASASTSYTQTVAVTGVSPYGVTVDRSGDLVISDLGASNVLKETPDGNGGYTQSVVAPVSGTGLAVDSAGDVFIAHPNNGNGGVLEATPDGNGGYTTTSLSIPGTYPFGMAVDGSGDLFVTDEANSTTSQLVKDTPDGQGGYTPSVIATFPNDQAYGVAVDASGDVYTATAQSVMGKETPNGQGGYTLSTVSTGFFSQAEGVAVDAAGDLFITDFGDGQVLQETPDGNGGYVQSVVTSDVSEPYGLALDASGDVFVADYGNSRIVEDKPVVVDTTPPSISVTHTVDGQNGYNVSSPVTETVTASDSGSGLAGAPSCTVDGTGATLTPGAGGTWTFSVSGDGTRAVSCSVSDNAGNSSSATDTVKIDTSVGKFVIAVPATDTAGQPFTVTVKAETTAGKVISTYSGSPTWSDSSGQLSSSPAAFKKGVSTNTVTLANPYPGDVITITDGQAVTSQSARFNVIGPLSLFAITVPSRVTPGKAFKVTVKAEDSFGQVIAGYHGSPAWSDTSGQLSGSPAAFNKGVSANTVTLASPYGHPDQITITDGTVKSTSNPFAAT